MCVRCYKAIALHLAANIRLRNSIWPCCLSVVAYRCNFCHDGGNMEGGVVPDPLTLTALGGVAATEGIKFLYGQAAELLKAWRERCQQTKPGEAPSPELLVPIIDSVVLDSRPAQRPADAAVLEKAHKSLVQLSGALSPYAQGQADVDLADEALAEQAGQLRALLEAAYHQRFTFQGEKRERTGSTVSVRQALGSVAGEVLGAKADVEPGSDLRIEQEADIVEEGGSLTGFKGTIGGSVGPCTDIPEES
jgi:hypothetical protein